MSGPRRFKDELGLEAQLLRSADDDVVPERSRRGLAAAIGLAPLASVPLPGPAPAAPAAAVPAAAAKAGVGIAAKALIALTVAAGLGVGVKVAVDRRSSSEPSVAAVQPAERAVAPPTPTPTPPPPAEVAVAPVPDVVPPSPPVVTPADVPAVTVDERAPKHGAPALGSGSAHSTPIAAATTPTEAATTIVEPPPTPPSADPASPARSTLADEIKLIDSALAALHRHDAAHALATLDDYDRRFPTGTMAPEAAIARIEATLAAGDATTARELGARFLAAHPTSPLVQRVRDLISHAP